MFHATPLWQKAGHTNETITVIFPQIERIFIIRYLKEMDCHFWKRSKKAVRSYTYNTLQ